MPGASEEINGVRPTTEAWSDSTFAGGRKTSRATVHTALANGGGSGQSGASSGFGDFTLGGSVDDSLTSDAANWAATFGAAAQSGGDSGFSTGGAIGLAEQGFAPASAVGAAGQTPAPTSVTVPTRPSNRRSRHEFGDVLRLSRHLGGGGLLATSLARFGTRRGCDRSGGFDFQFVDRSDLPRHSTGGTLTITNGAQTEKIALTGDYLSSTWTVSSDGAGGTKVVDPVANTNWQMMKVGAGGFADGLDVDPDGTMVVRTDTNGAYLWNGTSWQQLVTSSSMPAAYCGESVSSGQGVYEIQMAPSNSNIMYMMFDGYVFSTPTRAQPGRDLVRAGH